MVKWNLRMSETKKAFLATDKEIKLIEELRKVKFCKDIPVTVVDGQPTEIGEFKDRKRL
jgi:hypothetical protein